MLEKDIEGKVREYAIKKGLLVYKFTSPAKRSVPDRLFVTPNGKVFFIEFKKPGGKSTPGQVREQETLRGHNVSVFVVDNVAQGKFVIDLNS